MKIKKTIYDARDPYKLFFLSITTTTQIKDQNNIPLESWVVAAADVFETTFAFLAAPRSLLLFAVAVLSDRVYVELRDMARPIESEERSPKSKTKMNE